MPANTELALNPAKLMAVKLRLRGIKVDEVARQTGLSAPTIIKSHKQFLAGGWNVLVDEKRGRQKGQGSALGTAEIDKLLNAMEQSKGGLWSCEQIADYVSSQFSLAISGRAASHLGLQIGLLWEPWKLADLVNVNGRRALKRAGSIDDQNSLYFAYCRSVEITNGSTRQRKVQLAMQTPKHKRLWTLADWPTQAWLEQSIAALLEQVAKSRKTQQTLTLVLVGLDLDRAKHFQAWVEQQALLGRLELLVISPQHSILPVK